MEWKEVTKEEYEKLFENIFKDIRDLIEAIEYDPDIKYEGLIIKQELREIVRSLTKIENKLYKELNKKS